MIVDGRSLWLGVDGLRREAVCERVQARWATNRRAHAVGQRHLLAENVAGGNPAD
jgi:hypothetical protein